MSSVTRTLITYFAVIIAAAASMMAFGVHFEGAGLLLLWPLLLPLLLFTDARPRLGWLLTAAIVLELAAAQLAWHTIGEIHAGMLHVFVWLNALVVVAARRRWYRRTGIVGLSLFAILVPCQAVLGVQWMAIHTDAERMLQTAKAQQARTGEAPERLPQFEASYDWIEPHLRYRLHDGEPTVSYWIGTCSTSHWSTDDGWDYYPD